MSESRKLAAILAADVAGYSLLAGADEERTLARLRALRSELIDPVIAKRNGRVVKRTGDGILIEFRSVVDALRCAIEVQNGMVQRNAGMPPDRRIEFRVGIHLGNVVEESDGDLMGDGVNIAARLEGIARPGGVCLSEDAWRQVRGKVEADFADAGEQRLKHIARPVRAFHLAHRNPTAVTPLPLAARLAAALGVEPSHRVSPGALWRRKPALIGLLTLLALVGAAVAVRFWPDFEGRELAHSPTKNFFEAYDNYLKAENEGYYNVDFKAPARAMIYYGKAMELDPNFADARAGYALAAVQVLRYGLDYLMSPRVARKRAYDAASRALELDPNNGRAYVALALLQLGDGRHADAIASARRGVSLDPNQPEALANLGMILAYSGQWTEAVEVTARALRLRPAPPPGLRQVAGIVFYNARQYERAIEELVAVVAAWPMSSVAHEHLAAAYAHTGRLDLARSETNLLNDSVLVMQTLATAKLWYGPYYKRAEDLNHHLDGLRIAGLPYWPFDFKGSPEDRVTGEALPDLAFGHTWAGYAPVRPGDNVAFVLQIDHENRIIYKSPQALLSGIVRVKDDELCVQFDGYLSDLWSCGAVYRTRAVGGNRGADYVYVLPDSLKYFSVKD